MNIENDQYKIVDGNLIRCYESPGTLEFIPDGVTRIGNGAFVDCSVKIAEIPNFVKEIGDTAFHSCGPKKVVIHDGLEKMGYSPFFQWGESSIEEATVPLKFWHKFRLELKLSRLKKANLTGIGEALPAWAFERCVKLEDITMPNSIKVIEYGAFDCCSSLKRIDLPSELKK